MTTEINSNLVARNEQLLRMVNQNQNKNPNYEELQRILHNLSMVGDETSFSILGTANCGRRAESNYFRRPCYTTMFIREIDIFGGE